MNRRSVKSEVVNISSLFVTRRDTVVVYAVHSFSIWKCLLAAQLRHNEIVTLAWIMIQWIYAKEAGFRRVMAGSQYDAVQRYSQSAQQSLSRGSAHDGVWPDQWTSPEQYSTSY